MDITLEMLESKVTTWDWPGGGWGTGILPIVCFRSSALVGDPSGGPLVKLAAQTALEILRLDGDADGTCLLQDGSQLAVKEVQAFLRGLFADEPQAPVVEP